MPFAPALHAQSPWQGLEAEAQSRGALSGDAGGSLWDTVHLAAWGWRWLDDLINLITHQRGWSFPRCTQYFRKTIHDGWPYHICNVLALTYGVFEIVSPKSYSPRFFFKLSTLDRSWTLDSLEPQSHNRTYKRFRMLDGEVAKPWFEL